VVLAGDSAGGNLVLALLLRTRDEALPLPAAAMAISPWTDLTGSGTSIRLMAGADAMLPAERLAETAALYAAGADLTDPFLSPLFGDYRGMPPLLVHAGTTEILLDDARRLVARASEAGVEAQLRLWRGLPHVFHCFADYLPAGSAAIDEIAAFFSARLAR
jgi:acetyl esterase/lipase